MKRYRWIGGAFLIVVLLVTVEMTIISNVSGYEAKEKVVFARVQIEKNAVITEDMLELKEIGTGDVNPDALKDFNTAVSKRADREIEMGEMLLHAKLTSAAQGVIEAEDKSKRLFSVKFEVDQANGWQLATDQHVDIIYVPSQAEQQRSAAGGVTSHSVTNAGVMNEGAANTGGTNEGVTNHGEAKDALRVTTSDISLNRVRTLKNVRIAGLINEQGKLIDILESEGIPRYVSFEVTEEQADFLAYAKSNGKLELSCIPGK